MLFNKALLNKKCINKSFTKTNLVKSVSVQAALAAALLISLPASAAVKLNDAVNNTEFSFGGYMKVDAFWSDFSDGTLASSSSGRQFYVPSTVPVCESADCEKGATTFDAHSRATRFNFSTMTEIEGHRVKSFIEMDFLTTPGGNELVSNSYSPRLRHAVVSYDNWLVGQTWTTFQNAAVLPESLDFLGPAEGTIFERQVMVRYTNGPWQFSLENPESLIMNYSGNGRVDYDDSAVPDVVARYNHKADWGQLSLAGILRQLKIDNGVYDSTTSAYGLSAGGKINIGVADDIRFMGSFGSGIGRYLGLAITSDAVIDHEGDLEVIDSYGGFIAYRHMWNEKLRSTLSYSVFSADNETLYTGQSVTKSADSIHLNLIYSPIKPLSIGVEYIRANRELENGFDGALDRLQFSAKYVL